MTMTMTLGQVKWEPFGHSSLNYTPRVPHKKSHRSGILPLTSTYTWWAGVILCICCFSSDKCVLCTPIIPQMTDSSTEIIQGKLGSPSQRDIDFHRSDPQHQQQFQHQVEQEKFGHYGPPPQYDTLAMAPFQETLLTPGELSQIRFLGDDGKNEQDDLTGDENLAGSSSGQQWEMVMDPKFYIHTERESRRVNGRAGRQLRKRRNAGPSLSIVNPLDVLRQRLLIEIARRRYHTNKHHQINANTEYLRTIGRRRR